MDLEKASKELDIQVAEIPMDDFEAQPRKLSFRMDSLVGIIAIALSLFQLYTSWVGPFDIFIQTPIHIGFAFVIVFITYPIIRKSKKRDQILWFEWVLVAAALISTIWVMINSERYIEDPRGSGTIDLILGVVIILLILEAARRILGPVLPIIATLTILYALLGQYLPGTWAHKGFSLRMTFEHLYMGTNGVWGLVTGISATIIPGFLIFGVLLEKTGGGKTFVGIALRIAGRSHGGPGKVSCFSSALFGTISGSAVANVVVDGVFNIPLMKRLGYKPELAAAVEATTSTGGQIMPPVMGAGAFIMAELLGIPYSRVAIGAAIPAILYYIGCFFAIHFEAQRLHLRPLPAEMIPSFRKDILPHSLPFFLPVVVLVYFLSTGYSPSLSVLYSIVISTVWHLVTVRNVETWKVRLKQIIKSLDDGGRAVVMVAALCVCAQIVVSMFNMTGLGVKFTEAIIELSRGSMFLTLLFGMMICLFLGMGIPTTAAYVLAASVVAPSLVNLGAPAFSAHLFIFYFAIISAITPPVCGAVYVASAIARSNWWKTGWIAVRFGLSGFIVPFFFFYAPTLLLFGSPWWIILNSVAAAIGVYTLSAGAMGFFLRPLSWIERIIMIIAAILLIDPGILTDIIGLVLLGTVYLNQKLNFFYSPKGR